VIQFAEAQANNSVTVAKLDALITKVCNALHVSSFCEQNLLPLIPQIINAIIEKEQPQQVCTQIKLCDPQIVPVRAAAVLKANPLACGLCQGVVNLVEQQIQSNASTDQIDSAILKVCGKIKVSSWCQANILPQIPEILAMLVQKVSPDRVCTTIKICAKNESVTSNEEKAVEGFDLRCSICESVIGSAKLTAGDDQTQAGLSRALGTACGKVPFAKDICSAFLAPLAQKIVQDIINGADNHKICTNIKMCKN